MASLTVNVHAPSEAQAMVNEADARGELLYRGGFSVCRGEPEGAVQEKRGLGLGPHVHRCPDP
jgi:hypothetical protein